MAENVSIIAEKSDEALTRIETTAAVARTLTGQAELEQVDLAAITGEMASRVSNSYGMEVTTDLPDEALVSANVGLRSVVDNLIENAAEHNDAEEPQVHVGVERTNGSFRLSVADNGPGITDEIKENIVDPRSDDTEGGGLTLVQKLVEDYGGELRIEDNDPKGSVFKVTLPRADNMH